MHVGDKLSRRTNTWPFETVVYLNLLPSHGVISCFSALDYLF